MFQEESEAALVIFFSDFNSVNRLKEILDGKTANDEFPLPTQKKQQQKNK